MRLPAAPPTLLLLGLLASSAFSQGGRFHGPFPLTAPAPPIESTHVSRGPCDNATPHFADLFPGVDRTIPQYWVDVNREVFVADSRASEATRRGMLQTRVVPRLLTVLQRTEHPEVAAASLIALGKIGDPHGTLYGKLVPYLDSRDSKIAESATLALGILGDSRAIRALTQQLEETSGATPLRTRVFSAYALGLLGSREENRAHRKPIADALWRTTTIPLQATHDLKTAAILAMGLVPLPSRPEDLHDVDGVYSTRTPPRSLEEQVCWLLNIFTAKHVKMFPYQSASHAPRSIGLLLRSSDDPALKRHVVTAVAPYATKRGNVGVRE